MSAMKKGWVVLRKVLMVGFCDVGSSAKASLR